MKTTVKIIAPFLFTAFFLLPAGCSYKDFSPGDLASKDEVNPGEGVAASGKLQTKEAPREKDKQKSSPQTRGKKSVPAKREKPRPQKTEKEKPIKEIIPGPEKQEVSTPAQEAPSFIPLAEGDITGLEDQDGNATGITEKDKGLIFNFDNAPLKEVIQSLTRILKIDYMFIAEPQGEVTIHTSGTISREELFPLFYQILEANGLTAVKDGSMYKIVTMGEAPRHLTSSQVESGMDSPGAEQAVNIRIIPLQYINTGEMTKIITPFISSEGSIISHEQSNTLVLVDHPVNISKALRLIRSFDVNYFQGIEHAVLPVKYMESKELAESLKKMIAFYQKKSRHDMEIINLEKLNSLLILSESKALFHKARKFIKQLDQPGEGTEPHIYIYFIKNSTADNMASLLDSIFTKSKDEEEEAQVREGAEEEEQKKDIGNPFAQSAEKEKTTVTSKTPVSDFGSGTLRDEINITSDDVRNALIIEALPSDYQIVKRVLERLDILPRQVLISVTIAEVQLDDGLDLGMEWSWTHNSDDTGVNNSTWSALISGDSLSYTIGEAGEWSAALNALAQKQKVDILSSPSVLASDNKEAQINIATEVPVASAQIRYDDDNADRTQTDIQYRNTGVILNVTPHINENGLVSMEMNQEVSNQAGGVQVGGTSYPSFFKRSINTTLTVNNGQTIVIGGLISEDNSNSSSGVPFLSDLPGLGWLFGTQSQDVSKSELIVLIKPTVVASLNDVDAVTSEFAQKVGYDF